MVEIIITMKERKNSNKIHDFVFNNLKEMNEFIKEISNTYKNNFKKENENIINENIVNISEYSEHISEINEILTFWIYNKRLN